MKKKFNLSELKEINPFFMQFPDVEKIGTLFIKLFKNKKISIIERNNEAIISFMNIIEEKISLSIIKKESDKNEKMDKLSEIVDNLIKDMDMIKNENKEIKEVSIKIYEENKELKEEIKKLKEVNKKIKNELEELNKFKKEIEEEKEKNLYKLENSSILKDKEKIKMISNWIMPNRNIKYTQIYKATRDGGTGKDFHRCCDNKTPTLTLIESTNGYIFGGYISIPWESPSDWTYEGNDEKAFIFSVNNNLKFPIQNNSYVIYLHKDYGPDFGNNDIYLNSTNFLNGDSSCNCYKGSNGYNAPPEKIAGGKKFRVKELEVYLVQFE